MTSVEHPHDHSLQPPARLSAIVAGVVIAIAAANVWPLLLFNSGALLGAIIEIAFLALFIWWARGGGPPRALHTARINAFRRVALSSREMLWGVLAALSFAVTVHASIVLLFRFIPYPTAAFRQGYDLSFIPAQPIRWLAVVISAASAAICEETSFRGFLQQSLESRYSVPVAVLISSLLFMAVHLTKSWALLGMVPIVFGAGVLLGLMAWSAQSLIPGDRSFRNGFRSVCLLVDRYSRGLPSTPDKRNGGGSVFCDYNLYLGDLPPDRSNRDSQTLSKEAVSEHRR